MTGPHLLRVDAQDTLEQGITFIQERLRMRRHSIGVVLNEHEAEIVYQALKVCSAQFDSDAWFIMDTANDRGVFFAEEPTQ